MTEPHVTADRGPEAAETLLMGTISLDQYLARGEVLPGGGILNMAWHWRGFGRPFEVLTRVGTDGAPIRSFLGRHGIGVVAPQDLATPGKSSTIDIAIQADRQPYMDNFVGGVWDRYRLTPRERESLRAASRLHVVLVEGAIAELARLADDGSLAGVEVSADFLGFRHYTVERLAQTMGHVDLGIIGWPGDEDDPAIAGMRDVAFDLERLLVVTMGARSVRIFDGRNGGEGPRERTYAVHAVPVAGTTLGCGDAFIAWFLDELWRSHELDAAVARGMIGGAQATAWPRPLPDSAYDLASSHDQPF